MTGLGWPRLAASVAEQVPPAEVDGVWVFTTLRHEGREWGTAILSLVDGERRQIYTARYMLAIKGKERGVARKRALSARALADLGRWLNGGVRPSGSDTMPVPVMVQ